MAGWLKRVLGYLLAAGTLIWVLHGVNFGDVIRHLVIRQPAWLLLAVTADVLSYLAQGLRWRLLLLPVGNLSAKKAALAVYAGLFVNEVIPMRFGDVVRVYLAARWLSVRFTPILPSMVFERLTDGFWLAAGVGLVSLLVPLPAYMIRGTEILVALLLVSFAVLFMLVWHGRGTTSSKMDRAARAIHSASTAPAFWLAFIASSLILMLQTMAFCFAMKAYALPLTFWIGAAVALIVRLGTALPNTPANIGTFQFFVVAGLTFFGLDKASAAAFSVAVFMTLTIPLWLIGFFALGRTGLTLSRIRSGIGDLAAAEAAVQ